MEPFGGAMPSKGPGTSIGCVPLKKRFLWPYKHPLTSQSSEESTDNAAASQKAPDDPNAKKDFAASSEASGFVASSRPAVATYSDAPIESTSLLSSSSSTSYSQSLANTDPLQSSTSVSTFSSTVGLSISSTSSAIYTGCVTQPVCTGPNYVNNVCASVEQGSSIASTCAVSYTHSEPSSTSLQNLDSSTSTTDTTTSTNTDTSLQWSSMPLKYAIKRRLPGTDPSAVSYWGSTAASSSAQSAPGASISSSIVYSTAADTSHSASTTSDSLVSVNNSQTTCQDTTTTMAGLKVCRKKKLFNTTPMVNVNLPPRYLPVMRHLPSPRHIASTGYLIGTKYVPGGSVIKRKRTPQWMPQKLKPPVRHSARLRNKKAAKTFLAKFAAPSPNTDGIPSKESLVEAVLQASASKGSKNKAKELFGSDTSTTTATKSSKSSATKQQQSQNSSSSVISVTNKDEDKSPVVNDKKEVCSVQETETKTVPQVTTAVVEERVPSPTVPDKPPSPKQTSTPVVVPSPSPEPVQTDTGSIPTSEQPDVCKTDSLESVIEDAKEPVRELVPPLRISIGKPKKSKKKSKHKKREKERDKEKEKEKSTVVVGEVTNTCCVVVSPTETVTTPDVVITEPQISEPTGKVHKKKKRKGPKVVIRMGAKPSEGGSSQWTCALQTSPLLQGCKQCKVVLDKLPQNMMGDTVHLNDVCTPCAQKRTASERSPSVEIETAVSVETDHSVPLPAENSKSVAENNPIDLDSDDPDKLVIDISETPKSTKQKPGRHKETKKTGAESAPTLLDTEVSAPKEIQPSSQEEPEPSSSTGSKGTVPKGNGLKPGPKSKRGRPKGTKAKKSTPTAKKKLSVDKGVTDTKPADTEVATEIPAESADVSNIKDSETSLVNDSMTDSVCEATQPANDHPISDSDASKLLNTTADSEGLNTSSESVNESKLELSTEEPIIIEDNEPPIEPSHEEPSGSAKATKPKKSTKSKSTKPPAKHKAKASAKSKSTKSTAEPKSIKPPAKSKSSKPSIESKAEDLSVQSDDANTSTETESPKPCTESPKVKKDQKLSKSPTVALKKQKLEDRKIIREAILDLTNCVKVSEDTAEDVKEEAKAKIKKRRTTFNSACAQMPLSLPSSPEAKVVNPSQQTSPKADMVISQVATVEDAKSSTPPSTHVMEADADNSLNLLQEEFRGMKQGETRVIVITKKQYDAAKGTGTIIQSGDGKNMVQLKSGDFAITTSAATEQTVTTLTTQAEVKGPVLQKPAATSTKSKGGKFFSDYRQKAESQSSTGVLRYFEKATSKKADMRLKNAPKAGQKSLPVPSSKAKSSSSQSTGDKKNSSSWKSEVMKQIQLFNQDKSQSSESEGESSSTPKPASPQQHPPANESIHTKVMPTPETDSDGFKSPEGCLAVSPGRAPLPRRSQNYASQMANWVSDISDDDNEHGAAAAMRRQSSEQPFRTPQPVIPKPPTPVHTSAAATPTMSPASVASPQITSPAPQDSQDTAPLPSPASMCISKPHVLIKPCSVDMSIKCPPQSTGYTPSHLSSSDVSEWECEMITESPIPPPSQPQPDPTPTHVVPTGKKNQQKKSKQQSQQKGKLISNDDLYTFDEFDTDDHLPKSKVPTTGSSHLKKECTQEKPLKGRGRGRGKKMKGKFRMEGKEDPTYMPGAKGKGGPLVDEESEEEEEEVDLADLVPFNHPTKRPVSIGHSKPAPAPAQTASPAAPPYPCRSSPHVALSPLSLPLPQADKAQEEEEEEEDEHTENQQEEAAARADEEEEFEVSDEAFNARLFALYRHDRFKTRQGAKLRQIVDFTNVDWMERSRNRTSRQANSREGSHSRESSLDRSSGNRSQNRKNRAHTNSREASRSRESSVDRSSINSDRPRKKKRKGSDSSHTSGNAHIKLKIKLPKQPAAEEEEEARHVMSDDHKETENVTQEEECVKSDWDEPPHLSPIQQLDVHRPRSHYASPVSSHHNRATPKSEVSDYECPVLDTVQPPPPQIPAQLPSLSNHQPPKALSLPQFEDISSASENEEPPKELANPPFSAYEPNLKDLYERSKKRKSVGSPHRRKRLRDRGQYGDGWSDDEMPQLQSQAATESSDESDDGAFYSTHNMAFHMPEDSAYQNGYHHHHHPHHLHHHRQRFGSVSPVDTDSGSTMDTRCQSTPIDPLEEPQLMDSDLEGLIREAVTLSRDLEERIIQDPRSMVTTLDRLLQGTRTLYADIQEQRQKETSATEAIYMPPAVVPPIGLQQDWEQDDYYGGMSPAQPLCVGGEPNNVVFKTPATPPSVDSSKPGKRCRRRNSSKSGSRSPAYTGPCRITLESLPPEDNAMDKLLSQPSSRNFGMSPTHNVFAESFSEECSNIENSIDDIILGSQAGFQQRNYSFEYPSLGKYGEGNNDESSIWSNVDSAVDLTW